jgi:carboxylesterase
MRLAALILCLTATGCNTFTTSLVKRHDARVAHDPITGVRLGAEPQRLGSPSASGAVLFIHGFAGSPNNFNDLPNSVAAAGWYVNVMRLPGHGTSPFDFEKTTAQNLLDAVLMDIGELTSQYDRVVVVGHSMGGTLATLAAAQLTFDGLVLAAPHFVVTEKVRSGLSPEQWTKLFAPWIRWIHFPERRRPVKRTEAQKDIVMYSWIPSKPSLPALDLAERARDMHLLQKVTEPLLLIHAEDDRVTAPKASREAFAHIRSEHKEYLPLHNADHHLFWDYDAELVTKEILRFLTRLKP